MKSIEEYLEEMDNASGSMFDKLTAEKVLRQAIKDTVIKCAEIARNDPVSCIECCVSIEGKILDIIHPFSNYGKVN